MKRIIPFIFLGLSVLGCTISFENDETSFEDKAGTRVAVALTATALDAYFDAESEDGQAEVVKSTPAPTETMQVESDTQDDLGSPTYTDGCSSLSAWTVESVDEIVVEDITTIKIDNSRLSMRSSQVGKFHWRLNYQEFADGYLEAKFETGNCSGNDEYGLIFRAPDYSDGVGYYFSLTCDGQNGLRQKTEPYAFNKNSEMLIAMAASDKINQGSDQTNILGVRADGDSLKLYVNDYLINEISGVSLTSAGHIGLYIYARQTPGFSIYLDEISFWNLPN